MHRNSRWQVCLNVVKLNWWRELSLIYRQQEMHISTEITNFINKLLYNLQTQPNQYRASPTNITNPWAKPDPLNTWPVSQTNVCSANSHASTTPITCFPNSNSSKHLPHNCSNTHNNNKKIVRRGSMLGSWSQIRQMYPFLRRNLKASWKSWTSLRNSGIRLGAICWMRASVRGPVRL